MIKLHDQVIEWVMPRLVGGGTKASSPSAFIVYLFLWHTAQQNGAWTANVSYQTIANKTGLSRSSAQKAVRRLQDEGFLESTQPDNNPTATPEYRVLRPWRPR